jgi:hypothetical protein
MNKLILEEMNHNVVVYEYIPEGRGAAGKVVYRFEDKTAEISSRAEEDKTGSYGRKAVLKVEEVVTKKNLPLDLIQAWY